MRKPKKLKEPAIGSVFYEVGYKREEPCSPIIITRVYCGHSKDPSKPGAPKYYLAAEFSTWWRVTAVFKAPIEHGHCLKFQSLEDMLGNLKTWKEASEWVVKKRKNWRKAMKLN